MKSRSNATKIPEIVPRSPSEASFQRARNFFNTKKKGKSKNIFIDWDLFERKAQRLTPLKDICHLLGCHRATLDRICNRNFGVSPKELWNYYASTGKSALVSKLVQEALKGDATLLRYLADRFLFQEPKQLQEELGEVSSGESTSNKIEYSPTVKGVDLTPESIKKMMGEFLDLDPTHPLKKEDVSGN